MNNALIVKEYQGHTPSDLIGYSKEKGMEVEAYSPVAHGEILHHPEITKMAGKYGATVAQLCIRYCLQLGTIPLPKTGNPEHMKENAKVNFEISDEDMNCLKNVEHIKNYGAHSMFPVFSGK